MTINGSTNNSNWTYKLEVTETSTSIINRTSTIQVKAYLGRASSTSYLGGGYSVSVSCAGQTQTQSGIINYPTYISGGGWLELKTFTFTVSNTGNPTMINISSSMSSGDFTPSSASASGTMQLTILHLGPEISSINLVELNTDVSDTGVLGYHIVQYLSIKKFTINAIYSDDATLSNLKVYHNNVLIGTSSTNEVTIDFANVGILKTIQPGEYLMTNIVFELTDSLNGKTTKTYSYRVILYALPTYENTSTFIKRKTGNGAVLTDNLGLLNFAGIGYLADDNIGNNNSVVIEYKIWDTDDSEPANYIDITSSATVLGNNITIENYQISNLLFTDTYNYKIKISDSFGNFDEKIGLLSTGIAVWTEYKDRVDFLNVTKKGIELYPNDYSTTETPIGIFNNDIIYRKYLGNIGVLNNGGTKNFDVSSLNIDKIIKIDGIIEYDSNYIGSLNRIVYYYNITNNNVTLYNSVNLSISDGFAYIEYTKNTN